MALEPQYTHTRKTTLHPETHSRFPEHPRGCSLAVAVAAERSKALHTWLQIGKFQGEAEHSLRAEVQIMASTRGDPKPWTRPPIGMQFTVRPFPAPTQP